MQRRMGNIFSSRAIIFIIVLLFSMASTAQNKSGEKIKKAAKATAGFVDYVLNDVDTAYVEKSKYNLTFMPVYSLHYEHYNFSAGGDARQSIGLTPENRNKLTLKFGWRWLLIGYGIDLQKGRPQTDFSMNLYSSRFCLDLFYRKSSDLYEIKKLSGFNNGETALQESRYFDGLDVKQKGISLYYVFNKQVSYNAAYRQMDKQRLSAGSFVLGAGYNKQEFEFNYEEYAPAIKEQLNERLRFRTIEYNDFSLNLGYCYNWVFAKDFVACASLTPAVSYKKATLEYVDNKEKLGSINFDLTTRAEIVYNNGRYYAAAAFISNTYHYNKNDLSVLNGFGVFKVYVGYNFWRRKNK